MTELNAQLEQGELTMPHRDLVQLPSPAKGGCVLPTIFNHITDATP